MPDHLVIDGDFDLDDLGVKAWVDEAAWNRAVITTSDIEQRILEGEDRIEVIQPNGGALVYEIPPWREHPIKRLRVVLARWRHQRND